MKTLLFCALVVVQSVLLPVSSWAVSSQYTEAVKVDANGATLATGKNADEHKAISFTNGVTVNKTNLGLANAVYVSVRTDSPPCGTGATANICGSGTVQDTYDGSTYTKFDAVMRANNTKHVILAAGLYETEGYGLALSGAAGLTAGRGWQPASGLTLEGTGERATTLRLRANVPTLFHWMIGRAPTNDAALVQNDVRIENLIIDFNEMNQNYNQLPTYPGGWSQGVWLHGSRNTLRKLYFINYATRYAPSEIFLGMLGSSSGSDSYGNLIDDCEAGPPAGGTWPLNNGGVFCFSILGNGSGATTRYTYNSTLRNCRAPNLTSVADTSGPTTVKFVGAAWSINCRVENNYARNMLGPFGTSMCIYSDTGSSTNTVYSNNTFTNVAIGAYIAYPAELQTGLVFDHNTITLGQSGAQGVLIAGNAAGGLNDKMIITNNIIKAYGNIDPTICKGIAISDSTGVNVYNNTIDVGAVVSGLDTHYVTINTVTFGGGGNNHQSDGTPVIPVNASIGGYPPRYDYLANFGGIVGQSLTSNFATVNNLTINGIANGNGAGLSNVSVDAFDVNTTRRPVNDANYTVLNGKGDYFIAYTRILAPRTVTLPAATNCSRCIRIIKDEHGDAAANNLTVSPDIEGVTIKLDVAFQTLAVYTEGTVWHVLYKYPPSPP